MKCKKSIVLFTVVLTLTFFMIASVQASPLRSRTTLVFNIGPGDHTWSGELDGDFEGTIYFYAAAPLKLVGESGHALETWIIIGENDNSMMGTDTTLVNFANNNFLSNGVITEATGDWAHLEGSTFHARGYIDWSGVPTAPSEIRIN